MRLTKTAALVAIGTLACSDAAQDKAADVETLTIAQTIAGPADAAAADGFGSISGLAVTDGGDVLVADALNHVVHRFDATGAYRGSIGGRGGGPGEFDRPCCIAIDRHSRLWVRDTDGGFDVFQIDGDTTYFLRRVRMAHTDVNRYAPVTFDQEGNVIDIGARIDSGAGERGVYRFHIDSTSRVTREVRVHEPPEDSTALRTVERSVPSGLITHYLYQPYGPSELAAHSPRGEYAHAVSSRYAIDWRDSNGNLIRHVTFALDKGPALSAAEKAAADTTLMQAASGVGLEVSELGFRVPSHKPPLRALFFDQDGNLWVELAVADGAPRRAHVYSPDGELVRTVEWPANVSLLENAIRGDTAWGIARDELGVQTLVRLAF